MGTANDLDSLARNVKWEVLAVLNFGAVDADSLRYSESDKSGCFQITFNISTDILFSDEKKPILDIEPIILKYTSVNHVGLIAPEILSGRPDFPRNLQHLNPTEFNKPVSFCVARSGKQELYNRKGVYGLLERLNDWLNDAKTETLYADGWDPIPNNSDNVTLAVIAASSFQEIAGMNANGGVSYFIANAGTSTDGNTIITSVTPQILNSSLDQSNIMTISLQNAIRAMNKIPLLKNNSYSSSIPGVFCWAESSRIESDAHFSSWVNVASMKKGLKDVGLSQSLVMAKTQVEKLFNPSKKSQKTDTHFDLLDPKTRALVLCVGLWRPTYIDPTIAGLKKHGNGKNLELRFFLLKRKLFDYNPISKKAKLSQVISTDPPSADLYRDVSGESSLPPTTFLGAGTLGSKLINSALRGGIVKMAVIDNDLILPHNIARYGAGISYSHFYKTDYIEKLAKDVVPNIDFSNYRKNILEIQEQLAGIFINNEIIIDSTANPLVSQCLSKIKRPNKKVFKAEIFNKGRLGVCFHTTLGSTYNLTLMYYFLIYLARYKDNSSVTEWLKYESEKSFLDEELLLGFGCTSSSTKMPDYKIGIHANSIFSAIKKLANLDGEPMIYINPIDDDGAPVEAKYLKVPEVAEFNAEGTPGWKVIVTEDALKNMQNAKNLHSPSEAGGYLYGALNVRDSEIYVFEMFDCTDPSQSSGTKIEIGPSGKTPAEQSFIRRTANNIIALGAWHSHPLSTASPSDMDKNTFNKFIKKDRKLGLPTVMAITGSSETKFYVFEDFIE